MDRAAPRTPRSPIDHDAAIEERLLIDRCKRGDKDAFDALMRRYERKIYNFSYRLCGNYDEASDITADTFVRLYNSLGSFRGDSSFITWLFRIVTNIFLDQRKRVKARPQVSLEEMIELEDMSVTRQVEDTGPSPEDRAVGAERTDILQTAINSLPEYQRLMIVMYHTESRSYEEIAEMLDLPIGTVKSRLNRARLSLRDRLKRVEEHF